MNKLPFLFSKNYKLLNKYIDDEGRRNTLYVKKSNPLTVHVPYQLIENKTDNNKTLIYHKGYNSTDSTDELILKKVIVYKTNNPVTVHIDNKIKRIDLSAFITPKGPINIKEIIIDKNTNKVFLGNTNFFLANKKIADENKLYIGEIVSNNKNSNLTTKSRPDLDDKIIDILKNKFLVNGINNNKAEELTA